MGFVYIVFTMVSTLYLHGIRHISYIYQQYMGINVLHLPTYIIAEKGNRLPLDAQSPVLSKPCYQSYIITWSNSLLVGWPILIENRQISSKTK